MTKKAGQYNYDALGRKTEERAAAGGNCAVVPYQTAVTSYLYDGLGRLVAVADPGNNTTDYEYDARGNITQVTDARENVTTYSYNLLSQLVSVNGPLANDTINYAYDAAGRLAAKNDAKGQHIVYTYDSANYLAYLTEIDYITAVPSTEKSRTFKRDAGGRVTAYCDTGLITGSDCTQTNPVNPVYGYVYDALGRRSQITNLYLHAAGLYNSDVVMTNKYNQFGSRTELEVVEGSTTLYNFGYSYDGMGRIAQITDNVLSGATIAFAFFPTGRMAEIRHLNSTWTEFSYSGTTGQLTEVIHKKPGPTTISDFQYQYNARNDITQKEIDSIGTDYSYDSKDQLTQVNVGGSQTELYTYDGAGNRATSSGDTWTYNNGNQLTAYPSNSFTYDDNGNMITYQGSSKTMEYSVDDRLVAYKESNVTKGAYKYDIDGLRVAKLTGDTTTYFVYDGTVLLGEVSKKNGSITDDRYYTFMPGSYYPLAMVVFESGTPHGFDIHNDHLMTPQVLTSAGNTVVWQGSYKSFGEVTLTTSTVRNPIRFPGQYADGESGFYYNHWRYYFCSLGRYDRVDPLHEKLIKFAYKQILNYVYVYTNNPIRNVDLLGQQSTSEISCSYSCIDCATPIRNYWQRIYPAHAGEQTNCLRHCIASCFVVQLCGNDCAFLLGWGNEFLGTFDMDDVNSNAIGRECSSGNCWTCCREKCPLRFSWSLP